MTEAARIALFRFDAVVSPFLIIIISPMQLATPNLRARASAALSMIASPSGRAFGWWPLSFWHTAY